jgi:hypothetical protein
MKLLDRLLGRQEAPAPEPEPVAPPPSVALEPLLLELAALLEAIAGERPDPDVVRARLADTFRDLEADPIDPAEFDALAQGLDEGGWARLWLATLGASQGVLGPALPVLVARRGVPDLVRTGFIGFAAGSPLLTIDLLRQSPLRLEELTRRWLFMGLGALVEGEPPEVSFLALQRLDYARLLAEVDRARLSAEDRVAYLKKLQETRDASLPRRGKW